MKLDKQHLEILNYYEDLTGAEVKDCFTYHDKITIIVANGDIAQAIGSDAEHVQTAERELGEDIKVVEHTDSPAEFLYNFLQPLNVESVEDDDGVLRVKPEDSQTKGTIIGRGGRHIDRIKDIMSRHFDYDRITVE